MSLGKKAVTGVMWLTLSNYIQYGLSFIGGIIVARLLEPSDFGVVALASSLLVFFRMLGSWGLGDAIIQRQDEKEKTVVSTILSLQMALAFAMFLLVLASILILRGFYESIVIKVLLVLAFFKVFRGPFQVYGALIQKNFLMKQKALLDLGTSALSLGVAITMAVKGFGVWSLVASQVVTVVLSSIGAWWLSPWRPSLGFDLAAAKWSLRFGKSMFVSGIMEKVLHDLDDVAVGSLGTTESLGFYSKSYSLSEWLVRVIVPSIAETAQPTFAKLQNERARLSRAFELVIGVITRLSVPFYLVTGLLAPEIVRLLYGEKWLGVVPLYRLLIAYGLLRPLFNMCNYLHVAKGLPGVVAKIRLIEGAFFVPAIFLFVHFWGAMGAAICVDLMIVIGTSLILISSTRHVDISLARLFLPPAVSALASVLAFFALNTSAAFSSDVSKIIYSVGVIATTYVLTLFMSEGKVLIENLKMGRRMLAVS